MATAMMTAHGLTYCLSQPRGRHHACEQVALLLRGKRHNKRGLNAREWRMANGRSMQSHLSGSRQCGDAHPVPQRRREAPHWYNLVGTLPRRELEQVEGGIQRGCFHVVDFEFETMGGPDQMMIVAKYI